MAEQEPTQQEQVDASRRVLVDVLQVLGTYHDGLVIIGGWVPELLFPNKQHIGSVDVDLALDLRHIQPAAYDTMKDRLLKAGYRLKDSSVTNVFERELEGTNQPVIVKIDLVTGEPPVPIEIRSHEHVHGMNVPKLRGIELALDYSMELEVSGELPAGGRFQTSAKVATIPAFICMKAIAMTERQKPKDAYDIHFCLSHYEGGPKTLAASFANLRGQPQVEEAIQAMRKHFQSIEHIGPIWAGRVAAAHGADETMARQDAFQRTQVFFDELGNQQPTLLE